VKIAPVVKSRSSAFPKVVSKVAERLLKLEGDDSTIRKVGADVVASFSLTMWNWQVSQLARM
jgi:hypothetical protein